MNEAKKIRRKQMKIVSPDNLGPRNIRMLRIPTVTLNARRMECGTRVMLSNFFLYYLGFLKRDFIRTKSFSLLKGTISWLKKNVKEW